MSSETCQTLAHRPPASFCFRQSWVCLLASGVIGFGLHGADARAAGPGSQSASQNASQNASLGTPQGAPQGASGSPGPVTAWAASVHAALARQAHHAAAAARLAFTQSGLASWYGHDFDGKRTSSGVRFDPRQLTCAHRTLPLGTRLLVTSHETGRSVVVTVNDRGPYAGHDRIIDLSRAAAARLGMVQDGLNTVTVKRVVAPGSNVEVAQAADGDSSDQAIAAARTAPAD